MQPKTAFSLQYLRTAHVPSIEQLAPGLLEVVEASSTKKWFGEYPSPSLLVSSLIASWPVSGGFATVHPNNKLTINAIEAYELDQFSPEVRSV